MTVREQFARWFVAKYLPDMHLHYSPGKSPKYRQTMSETIDRNMKEMVRSDVRRGLYAPDPKDFEDPAEYEHEREKWVMKMEAQREGDR